MATNEAGKQTFVKQWYATAKAVADRLFVPVEAILGQWALETDWGNSVIKGTGFNIGNIKVGSSWAGNSVQAYDKREKSNDFYRVYNSPDQFANDYVNLINANRFKNAIGSRTPQEYFTKLQSGKLKYATDPDYVKSATATANSVSKTMEKMGVSSNTTGETSGIKKWFLSLPSTTLLTGGILASNKIMNHEDGVLAGAGEVAGDTVNAVGSYLPDVSGIVDGAGNFALRAVVILSAIAIIVLGFYFMFKQEITNVAKAVTN